MLLNKSQILKVERRKFKELEVPELGGALRLASLSAGCGMRLKEASKLELNERALSVILFSSSIVDEKGEAIFSEDEATKFVELISIETMNLLVQEILALSGRGRTKLTAVANGVEAAPEVPPENPSAAAPSSSSPTA